MSRRTPISEDISERLESERCRSPIGKGIGGTSERRRSTPSPSSPAGVGGQAWHPARCPRSLSRASVIWIETATRTKHKEPATVTDQCIDFDAICGLQSIMPLPSFKKRLFFKQVLPWKGISTSGQAHPVNYLLLTCALGLVM